MSPFDINGLLGNPLKITTIPNVPLNQEHLLGSETNKGVSSIERTHYSHPYHQYDYHGSYGYKKKGKTGGKRSIALTALTLLSFLYFLHILQSCIQDQMDAMIPQVIIMQARIQAREQEAKKRMGQNLGVLFNNDTLLPIQSKEEKDPAKLKENDAKKSIYEYENKQFDEVPVKLKSVEIKKLPFV